MQSGFSPEAKSVYFQNSWKQAVAAKLQVDESRAGGLAVLKGQGICQALPSFMSV